MIIERHNVACRLIREIISKGPLARCLVHMDAGSAGHLSHGKVASDST